MQTCDDEKPPRVVCLVVLLSLFSLSAYAQTSTEILGLVTDSTNAIIPNATVTVRRIATGDVRTTTTNETGNYLLPLLEIGEYEGSAEHQAPARDDTGGPGIGRHRREAIYTL